MTKNYLCAFFTCALLLNTPCWTMQKQDTAIEMQDQTQLDSVKEHEQIPKSPSRKNLILGSCACASTILCITAGLAAIAIGIPLKIFLDNANRANEQIQFEREAEQRRCDQQSFLQDIMRRGSDIVAPWDPSLPSRFGLCNFTLETDNDGFTKSMYNNSHVAFLACDRSPIMQLLCQASADVRCYRVENPPSSYAWHDYSNGTVKLHVNVLSIKKTATIIFKDSTQYLYDTSRLVNRNHVIFQIIRNWGKKPVKALKRKEHAYFNLTTNHNNAQHVSQKHMTAHVKDRRQRNKK